MKNNRYFLNLALILLLLSCTQGEKDYLSREAGWIPPDGRSSAEKAINQDFSLLFGKAPTPCEIPFLLQATRVEFDSLLVNPLDKHIRISNNYDHSALNLGVYSTDFGYLASFGSTDEALLYLSHCQVMADCLKISTAFDKVLMNKLKEKIESPDTLARIVKNEIQSITKYLRGDFRSQPAVLVLTGGLVEGLYLSVELLANSSSQTGDNRCIPDILQLLAAQRRSVLNTIDMLNKLDASGDVAEISVRLSEISDLLENLDTNHADLATNGSWLALAANVRELRSSITAENTLL
ncbi:MAG: hypothetical protein OEY56_06495 [Cyclobacteriaceae bacterium]|nr:hypothetical protein [Cyclobacteriaceae bacterium]